MPSSRSGYESGATPRRVPRLMLISAALVLAALVAGFVVLGLIDVAPAPQSVEKVIPGDRRSR